MIANGYEQYEHECSATLNYIQMLTCKRKLTWKNLGIPQGLYVYKR